MVVTVPLRFTVRVTSPALSWTETVLKSQLSRVSSSVIVTVETALAPTTASPVGELRVTVKSSLDSTSASLVILTTMLFWSSPAAKLKVFVAAVKSVPEVAVTPAVE